MKIQNPLTNNQTDTKISDGQAVYIGRRISVDGKILQAFQVNNENPIFFTGVNGVYLGYTYKMNLEKGTISKRPDRVDLPLIDNPEWEAADALVEVKLKGDRDARKLAALSKPRLKAAVEAISPLLKGLGYSQRSKLVNMIIDMAEGRTP